METHCKLNELIADLELELITSKLNCDNIDIRIPDINRPGLPMTGFTDYYDNNRIQIVGHVETAYLSKLNYRRRLDIYI